MSKVLLSLFMLTLWGQLLIEKLRKSLGLPFSIRLFFVFSAVVWILVAQCCKRQENFLFFFKPSESMFLGRLWSLYWKLLPMREFFFRKEQLPFVAVALIAAESWDRLSSPPGRRELSCCCFSLKSSPSYDHLGSRTTQFCESSAKKSFCRTTRTKVSKTAKVQIPPFF